MDNINDILRAKRIARQNGYTVTKQAPSRQPSELDIAKQTVLDAGYTYQKFNTGVDDTYTPASNKFNRTGVNRPAYNSGVNDDDERRPSRRYDDETNNRPTRRIPAEYDDDETSNRLTRRIPATEYDDDERPVRRTPRYYDDTTSIAANRPSRRNIDVDDYEQEPVQRPVRRSIRTSEYDDQPVRKTPRVARPAEPDYEAEDRENLKQAMDIVTKAGYSYSKPTSNFEPKVDRPAPISKPAERPFSGINRVKKQAPAASQPVKTPAASETPVEQHEPQKQQTAFDRTQEMAAKYV